MQLTWKDFEDLTSPQESERLYAYLRYDLHLEHRLARDIKDDVFVELAQQLVLGNGTHDIGWLKPNEFVFVLATKFAEEDRPSDSEIFLNTLIDTIILEVKLNGEFISRTLLSATKILTTTLKKFFDLRNSS